MISTRWSVFNLNGNATSVKVIRLSRIHERHDKEQGARKEANGRKMRRKTIAKRILYTGHEGCGEQAEEASHILCVCEHEAFVPGVSFV